MIIPSSRAQSHAKQQFVKQFSIHRWAIIFFLTLFVIVITASVIGVVWASRLNVRYKNLRTAHDSQQDDYQRIKVEIEKVSEMESTIREVLGLDDAESNPSALGQGGFGGGEMSEGSEEFQQQSPPKESFSVPQASVEEIDDNASLVEKASTLNARLRKIIDFVQAKKTEMSQMPSINPIQSDEPWYYSSGFGYRKHPLMKKQQMHRGLDISARISTPVSATADGKVLSITKDAHLGRCVRIYHNSQYSTVYAHLHRYAEGLKEESVVKRGDIIGYVGSSGRTTGPHLHYEVWENDKPKNPKHYILD